MIKALKSIYPQYNFKAFKFRDIPRTYWNDKNNQREYFDELAVELKVSGVEDWYNISIEEVQSRGGAELLKYLHET
jgi:hypothetical protein